MILLSLLSKYIDIICCESRLEYTYILSQYVENKACAYIHPSIWPMKSGPCVTDKAVAMTIDLWHKIAETNPLVTKVPDPPDIPDSLSGLDLKKNIVVHARANESFGLANGRNVDISLYGQCFRDLIDHGYTITRIGDCRMPSMPSIPGLYDLINPGIVCDKSWLHVWLIANSMLFLGSQSGPSYIPHIFGTPFIIANNVCMGIVSATQEPMSFMLPKLWIRKDTQEPMNLEWIFTSRAAWLEADMIASIYEARHISSSVMRNSVLELARIATKHSDIRGTQSIRISKGQKAWIEAVIGRGGLGKMHPSNAYLNSYRLF